MRDSEILRIMSRKIFPFMLLFGCYLIAYGHISPGGGFQGGVVLGSSVILLCLCYGLDAVQKMLPGSGSGSAESAFMIALIAVGLLGIVARNSFLGNITWHQWDEPLPRAGTILVLDVLIGLKVGAGMTALFYHMARDER